MWVLLLQPDVLRGWLTVSGTQCPHLRTRARDNPEPTLPVVFDVLLNILISLLLLAFNCQYTFDQPHHPSSCGGLRLLTPLVAHRTRLPNVQHSVYGQGCV